jgi:hypothetical protein
MSDRRLLLIAVAIALIFSGGWLWRAAGDGATPRHPVPAGQAGRIDDVSYRLVSLQALERTATQYDDPIVPPPGAVLVLARIDYDAIGTRTFFSCTFELVAGEATWGSEFGYFPPDPDSASCDPNATGTVAVVFEVPARYLDQVQGVGVVNPGGTEELLVGRPG